MTRAEPAVTVAMVTYNSEPYVREAVESVLAQDFRDFELLVCDDASSDGTVAAVRMFQDPRIRVVVNQRNMGEYPNRNQALDLARGRYLMFVDGDDILYAHGLSLMVRMMEQFPNAAFAAARPWSEQFLYPVELSAAEFYRCQYLGPTVAAINFAHLMFRVSSLREVGGFDARYRSGDTQVQFRLAARNCAVLVMDGISWWRRTPGQASQALLRDGWLAAESTRYMLEALESSSCPLSAAEVAAARANTIGVFLRIALRCAIRGRLLHAIALVRASGIRLREWKYALLRSRRPYLDQVTAAEPIRIRMRS